MERTLRPRQIRSFVRSVGRLGSARVAERASNQRPTGITDAVDPADKEPVDVDQLDR